MWIPHRAGVRTGQAYCWNFHPCWLVWATSFNPFLQPQWKPRGKMWLLLLSTAIWWLSPPLLAGVSGHQCKMKSWWGHLINVLEKDRWGTRILIPPNGWNERPLMSVEASQWLWAFYLSLSLKSIGKDSYIKQKHTNGTQSFIIIKPKLQTYKLHYLFCN